MKEKAPYTLFAKEEEEKRLVKKSPGRKINVKEKRVFIWKYYKYDLKFSLINKISFYVMINNVLNFSLSYLLKESRNIVLQ